MTFERNLTYLGTSEKDYLEVQGILASKKGVIQLESAHELTEGALYNGCAVVISHKPDLRMTSIAVASEDDDVGRKLFNELELILKETKSR
jgi:hypothetical protein